jgi:hypothetical protein
MNPLWRQFQPGKHPHKPFLSPLAHNLNPMYRDAIRQVTSNALSRTLIILLHVAQCTEFHSVLLC